MTALSVPETGESLTYAELDQLANQLAAVISDAVSEADQVVAVRLPQDSATVVALHLAILKAGATQCFIDPDAPDELFLRVLNDAQPALLISDVTRRLYRRVPIARGAAPSGRVRILPRAVSALAG